ncbi:MAG: T9SS type A sorting domain-containing protein [Flaviramulus sp.]|nr:T9SS type A sorting domain-containing protein [Flaviramulus sp.]NNC49557.1 T9SS type A sorting domain-containing protein [Flaviramulus sp.]
MKKITYLFVLLAVSLGYSQQVLQEDFEGTAPTVNGFEGLGSATVTTDPQGDIAFELISAASGQGWQGAELIFQNNLIDLTSDLTVSADVYSTSAFNAFAKVEDKVNSTAPPSASSTAHTGSGWENITWTFNQGIDGTVTANGEYSQIAFFPFWNGAGWDTPVDGFTFYVDNVTAVSGATLGVEDYQLIDFSTYPNPTRDSWTVKTKNKVMSSIQVFDVLGKNVLSMKPNLDSATIDGSNLKAGIYFAQVRTAEGSSSIKLIKQ